MPREVSKIADLNQLSGNIVIPDTLVECLASEEITPLVDIRHAGGLADLGKKFEDLQELPEVEKKAARRLDADA